MSLFKSDLQSNSLIYWFIAIYFGIIIFIVNVSLINSDSLNIVTKKWEEHCVAKISIEIPNYAYSSEKFEKIQSILKSYCEENSIKMLSANEIQELIKNYVSSDIASDLYPKIIEATPKKNAPLNQLEMSIKEIDSKISTYNHKEILNPAIKISNFIKTNYFLIAILVIISALLYAFVYSYQNLLINKENIYILTLLSADNKYIFKQTRGPLIIYFLISSLIGFFLTAIFFITSINVFDVAYSIPNACLISLFTPIVLGSCVIFTSKYATNFLLKNNSFEY